VRQAKSDLTRHNNRHNTLNTTTFTDTSRPPRIDNMKLVATAVGVIAAASCASAFVVPAASSGFRGVATPGCSSRSSPTTRVCSSVDSIEEVGVIECRVIRGGV